MNPSSVSQEAQAFADFMESESTKNNGHRSRAVASSNCSRATSISLGNHRSESKIQAPAATIRDSRAEAPKTWAEVTAIQAALEPTIVAFSRVTNQRAPETRPWHSYAEQHQHLQQWSNRAWRDELREGMPPKLTRLQAWTGGIMDYKKAAFELPEASLEGYQHREVLERQRLDTQEKVIDNKNRFEAMETESVDLKMWKAQMRDRVGSSILGPLSKGEDATRKGSAATKDLLDAVVAGNPYEYKKWLREYGYGDFMQQREQLKGPSWDLWCDLFAPSAWEWHCELSSLPFTKAKWRLVHGVPGVTMAERHGSVAPRPTVSLGEAMNGHGNRMARFAIADHNKVRAVNHATREGRNDFGLSGVADKMKARFDEFTNHGVREGNTRGSGESRDHAPSKP